MMSGIKGKDTKPEMIIRKGLHARGFRYKLYDKSLPGKPDLVLPKYNAVIFVHGCFWHGHDCHLFKWPKTRIDFWREKIGSNIVRDEKHTSMIERHGIRVAVIWECGLKNRSADEINEILNKLENWLINMENHRILQLGS
nr:very short patch repair endonuclease [Aquisalinus luteolus]